MAEMFAYRVQAKTSSVSEGAFDVNDESAMGLQGAGVEAIAGHLPATMAMVGVGFGEGKRMLGMEAGSDSRREVDAGLMNVEFAGGANESWGIQCFFADTTEHVFSAVCFFFYVCQWVRVWLLQKLQLLHL